MTHLIFHHNDADGYVAAAAMRHYISMLTSITEDEIIPIPKSYGDTFDPAEYVNPVDYNANLYTVYFLDLSFTKDTVKSIYDIINKNDKKIPIIWIDHHESSKAALEMLMKTLEQDASIPLYPMFDTRLCGAALTYIYCQLCITFWSYEHASLIPPRPFLYVPVDTIVPHSNDMSISFRHDDYEIDVCVHPGEYANPDTDMDFPIPPFIYFIDCADRFQMDVQPLTTIFTAGLGVYTEKGYTNPMDNPLYDTNGSWLAANPLGDEKIVDKILTAGKSVDLYIRQGYKKSANQIYSRNIFGCKFYLKNAFGNSLIFKTEVDSEAPIYETDPNAYGCIWGTYDPKQEKWRYTLALKKSVRQTANKICELFGGGGHPGVGGFSIPECLFGMSDGEIDDVFMKYASLDDIDTAFDGIPGIYKTYHDRIKEDEKEAVEEEQRNSIPKKIWIDGTPAPCSVACPNDLSLMLYVSDSMCQSAYPINAEEAPSVNNERNKNSEMAEYENRVFIIYPIDTPMSVIGRIYQSLAAPGKTYVFFVNRYTKRGRNENDDKVYTIDDYPVIVQLYNDLQRMRMHDEDGYYRNHLVTECGTEADVAFGLGYHLIDTIREIEDIQEGKK